MSHGIRKKLLFGVVGGAAVMASVAAGPTAATAAPADAAPRAKPAAQAPDGPGTVSEWGKNRDGSKFSRTYRVKDAPTRQSMTATMAAAAAHCYIYISDISGGTSAAAGFTWNTSQYCTGTYGSHYQRSKAIRSSWRGWLDYSSWGRSRSTTAPSDAEYWTIRCNFGSGWYDYIAVVQGYASGIGWGPQTRSNNSLHRYCGPSA